MLHLVLPWLVSLQKWLWVRKKTKETEFCAYGTPEGMADPMARTIEALRAEINTLKNRVEELEDDTDEQQEAEQKLDVVSGGR